MLKKDKKPITSLVPQRSVTVDRKKSIFTAINNYPGRGSDLRGCVNDARAWKELLEDNYGFNTKIWLDRQVKIVDFIEYFGNIVSDSKASDSIVWTYSGHGTNVPDRNGDEKDGRDEALCFYDGFLIDDQIKKMFSGIHPQASLTFISDSCHSGTVTRSFLNSVNGEADSTPRYLPPEDDFEASLATRSNITSKSEYSEEDMKEILISGCLPTEFSYDAKIGGNFRGAMSYYAIEVLKRYPVITYENFYNKLQAALPSSRYAQSPCLEGSSENKKKIMFK